jgi:MscS family membrane protein
MDEGTSATFSASSLGWILEILLVILFLMVAQWGLQQFVKYLRRRILSTSQGWKEKIDLMIYPPLKAILWIIGTVYVLTIIALHFSWTAALPYLSALKNAAIVFCLAWFFLRWIKEVLQNYKKVDPGIAQILGKLLSFGIIMLAGLLLLQILGLNVMPLVAFGGVGAAALGFAAKDVISNFFGGFMVHITRPFTLGDLIILPERQIEGHVESIGWYLTAIRDKDKRPVYLPNAFFSTLLVINGSRMSHRRLEEKITLRYDDIAKIPQIVTQLKETLLTHPKIDRNLPVIVSFDEFKDYSLVIYIDTYTLTTRLDEFQALKQELLLKIYEIISAHSAAIPLPTTLIYQIKKEVSKE